MAARRARSDTRRGPRDQTRDWTRHGARRTLVRRRWPSGARRRWKRGATGGRTKATTRRPSGRSAPSWGAGLARIAEAGSDPYEIAPAAVATLRVIGACRHTFERDTRPPRAPRR